jgi:hypothetical protein
MSKGEKLIPLIIGATDREKAINVLNETLKVLHLTTDYLDLVKLKDKLDEYQEQFKEISKEYEQSSFPREYHFLAKTRDDLAFLYRDITDSLSFEINSAKIRFGEDAKTEARGESIMALKDNADLKINDKKVSVSQLREVYGVAPEYKEYLNLYSISYGLYQNLIKLFESIKMLSDSISSQAKVAHEIDKRDVK